jgi:NADH-quinone oxidoreductase subunit E
MLSEEEIREIEAELPNYEFRQAACLDALMIVQKHRGWVNDDALQDVAGYLGMATHELESVASFYNRIFRKPVGRHVIYLCEGITCWALARDRLRRHIRARFGIDPDETTPDGRFTLQSATCLGACDHAPAMMVDEDTHLDLDEARLDQILEKYR